MASLRQNQRFACKLTKTKGLTQTTSLKTKTLHKQEKNFGWKPKIEETRIVEEQILEQIMITLKEKHGNTTVLNCPGTSFLHHFKSLSTLSHLNTLKCTSFLLPRKARNALNKPDLLCKNNLLIGAGFVAETAKTPTLNPFAASYDGLCQSDAKRDRSNLSQDRHAVPGNKLGVRQPEAEATIEGEDQIG